MGKGAQKQNSSDQEEVLNNCSDAEKQYKWGSNTSKSDWKRSHSVRVSVVVCVMLMLLVFTLLVTLTVVRVGSSSPQPDFSHVCPDTWLGFQGKCYYFSEDESNWTTSQESCVALGASLASINTMDELVFIKRYKGEANRWFGLRKEKDESWWWTNGTAFNNWFEVRGGGPCAYLNQESISSSLCQTKKNWLCSKPDSYVLWKQTAYP
ncbi:C-type lectin domain family 2 member D-like isoform X2 [Falco biarmicus]|uniref:C-type lectin domain family 2 member D-like isoform X1 n=1 Tax=Falco cherrug TaxID=345164 RepID=UPI0024793EAC|nr:C-type lectin domain family 2 member D-like isoform X1 [Falco cherrug]XP_055553923.1 C-type lectin domain family 2 member D-like isoform X1 [Falco cherrug]XP_055553924.1 C-type lectin domain family 2 member D-like isoform X1 [Falco cherrug]XP_055553925.1 C-type lectin domain family 2 member D-like isoform X1 [Falco cherrug]XP_055553926.1 C-type lectin domain family 2 member D-like isoform X1 [Falco cherrug]XP_055553927.1 C-type lectin domain family 2 member D-like isoform X1 [Falco cherrug]